MDAREVSFGLESFKGVSAKILMAGLGFAGSVVFAREIGPAQFGGFYLMLSVLNLSIRPLTGVHDAAKKRIAEVDAVASEFFGALVLVAAVTVAVLLAAAFGFSGPFTRYTGVEQTPVLFGLVLTAVLTFMTAQTVLRGQGQFGTTELIDLVRSVVTLGAQLALVVLVGWGAAGMAVGLAVATLLTAPLSYRQVTVRPALPSRATLRSLYEFARFSSLNHVLGKARERFDILLIGLLISQAAAGQYEVAFKLTLPAMFVAQATSTGVLVRTSSADAAGDDATEDLENAMAFSSILSLPLFAGVLVLSTPLVVTVYGTAFAPAAPLLVGLAAYRVIGSQLSLIGSSLDGLNFPELNTAVSAVSLVANVALGVWLAFRMGPLGVVIATVVTAAADYLLRLYFLSRIATRPAFPAGELGKQVAASALMGAVVWGSLQFLAVRSWVDLVVLVGLGVLVYGTSLVAISSAVRQTARSVFEDAVAG